MFDFYAVSGVILAALGLGCWITCKYLRMQLRAPPANFEKIVALSMKTGAPLPAAVRTPTLRRQLILASSRPAALTNLMDMGTDTLNIKKLEKRPLIYGFLHPNADASGGGERVLWAAVKELVTNDTKAVAAIYVSAKGMTQASVLEQVAQRFDIRFSLPEANRIVFIVLTQTRLVDPEYYMALTLLGQAVGMMVLGYEAISNLMPDVFVDTTGLAFAYPVVSWFAKVPIIAYVHYPFVQSEMIASLRAKGLLNSPKRLAKYFYWKVLNIAYRWSGSFANIVATNSTWTKEHLSWPQPSAVVYPPCAVQAFSEPPAEKERSATIVYLAQFRPEKRHEMVIRSFAKARQIARKSNDIPSRNRKPHLILIGSVRDEMDALRVQGLNVLALELGLTDADYTIVENAPWLAVKSILESSLIGINAMWNEHFGMGVVEIMAAGLIPVAHASAGPLYDIVKDKEGVPGFLFRSAHDPDGLGLNGYPALSEAILRALSLSPSEHRALSLRAHRAAERFSDASFVEAWEKQRSLAAAKELEYRRTRKQLKLFD